MARLPNGKTGLGQGLDMDYDYIIVGSGPSGCVAASRLVRDHGAKVLMLEAGPRNNHPLLKMPAGFIKMLTGSKYLTFQETIPQPQLNGRVHQVPQGQVLGGGSTVNAMVYMRGRPSDYDQWNKAGGAVGWGWDDLLPHYIRQERNQSLADPAHGIDGPMSVSNAAHICEMSDLFVKSMQKMGHPLRSDFNAGTQTGVGSLQFTPSNGNAAVPLRHFWSRSC